MLELIQITNDPAFAAACESLGGFRLFVDLEREGKAERQAGRNTFISDHQLADVARVRAVLHRAPLMVRVNPWGPGSAAEVEKVLAHRPDLVMLPMFRGDGDLQAFCRQVAGRARVVALLETADALESLDTWSATPGLHEIYVGLNDLHLSLGLRFMFEPLAQGVVARVAAVARSHGLRFGFGGIARMDEGLLPGHDVLAEHLRLGSQSVILSRTFHHDEPWERFAEAVAALRLTEARLRERTPTQVQADARRIADRIEAIAGAAPCDA